MASIAVGIASWLDVSTESTSYFPMGVVAAAVALALISGIRRWKKFPVAPLVGIAFSSVGYLMNNFLFMIAGFFVFIIFTMWHEHKVERKLRSGET